MPTRKGSAKNKVILACETCQERNYSIHKSRQLATQRLELTKYCPRCNAHTVHKETK